MGDEQRVGEKGAGEDAAGLEVVAGVGGSEAGEGGAEGEREEDCAERSPVFKVGRGGKGVGF